MTFFFKKKYYFFFTPARKNISTYSNYSVWTKQFLGKGKRHVKMYLGIFIQILTHKPMTMG